MPLPVSSSKSLAELVVVDAPGVDLVDGAVIAADATQQSARVVAVGEELTVGVGHPLQAVPGVELVAGDVGRDLAALQRDGALFEGDLAQRAVLAILGAGRIGDAGDAADPVAELAQQ